MKTAKQLGFPYPARPTSDGAHMTVHDVTFRMPMVGGVAHEWKLSRSQYEYPLDGADLLMLHPLVPDLETGYGDVTAEWIAVYRFFLAEQPNGFNFWQPMAHEWNWGDSALVAASDIPRGRK